jgi:hypothetical protein
LYRCAAEFHYDHGSTIQERERSLIN